MKSEYFSDNSIRELNKSVNIFVSAERNIVIDGFSIASHLSAGGTYVYYDAILIYHKKTVIDNTKI